MLAMLYYKIKSKLDEKITRFRFRKINGHIPFYDKKKHIYRLFFDDDDRYDEEGSIEYVISEYIMDGLIYEYDADGERNHEHTFSAILDAILEDAKAHKQISIEKYKNQYSIQEQKMIEKLLEKIRTETQCAEEL